MTDGPNEVAIDLIEHPGHLARRLYQMTYVLWSDVVSLAVTPPQFVVLAVLAQHPGIDQTTLSYHSHFDQSTIADVTRRLLGRGLVERMTDPSDRRRNVLTLTVEGRAALDDIQSHTVELNNILLSSLNSEERRTFLELMLRVIKSTEDLTPRTARRGRGHLIEDSSRHSPSDGRSDQS